MPQEQDSTRVPADAPRLTKHLWEVGRPRWLRGIGLKEMGSFADLVAEVYALTFGEFMVFAWEWHEEPDRRDKLACVGDVFQAHILLLGSQDTYTLACPIDKAQEYDVLEWLHGPRVLGFLRNLWTPLLDATPIHLAVPAEAALWQQHIGVLDKIRTILNAEIDAARSRAARAAVRTPSSGEGTHR